MEDSSERQSSSGKLVSLQGQTTGIVHPSTQKINVVLAKWENHSIAPMQKGNVKRWNRDRLQRKNTGIFTTFFAPVLTDQV